ncbi:N-acetylmuramoyl-L-alanine amidase [Yoonia sp.]|uniref:N-acetylmuramoyl-L-alanine amidase n=1 Tax=Yoonia sp. TaxID=2212373 RepID=UPI0035C7B384
MRWQHSPNYGPRRDGALPDLILIHYTAMQSTRAAADTLCNPETQVSAHYLIGQDGEVIALVPEDQRAWHAGAGQWGDVSDVNSRSIGIELANAGSTPFAAAQMDALVALLKDITSRWAIRPERVIGHSDMAPGRKIDPGARFDWRRLALENLSVWPSSDVRAQGADPADFVAAMQAFGYSATQDASLLRDVFRLRFRPRHEGPLDATDMAMILELAGRFPVDAKDGSA